MHMCCKRADGCERQLRPAETLGLPPRSAQSGLSQAGLDLIRLARFMLLLFLGICVYNLSISWTWLPRVEA